MIKKTTNSFFYAFNGLRTTWNEENNFRIEVVVAFLLSIFMVYFKFSFIEAALCVFAMTLVLTSEIINTAIEDLCNRVEPNHDPLVGKIKDTVGAFVLVAGTGSIVIGVMVFIHHFTSFWY